MRRGTSWKYQIQDSTSLVKRKVYFKYCCFRFEEPTFAKILFFVGGVVLLIFTLGIDPKLVVKRLEQEHRILASTTPTRFNPDARFAAGLMNNEKDVDLCLSAVAAMARKV